MGTQGMLVPGAQAVRGRLATAIAKRPCGWEEPAWGPGQLSRLHRNNSRLGITLVPAQV